MLKLTCHLSPHTLFPNKQTKTMDNVTLGISLSPTKNEPATCNKKRKKKSDAN